MSYATTSTPIPESVKNFLNQELKLLSDMLKQSPTAGTSYTFGSPTPAPGTTAGGSTAGRAPAPAPASSRTPTGQAREDFRVHSSVPGCSTDDCLFNGVPRTSPDVYRRPGFEMNDYQIRHRASAAAFDSSRVGGPDYKQRATQLCSQIRGANIGEPAEFGCVEDPKTVGDGYSWKGNYQMVCSRLGTTWGSWYPTMFGCPSTTPDDIYNGNLL